MKKVVSAILFCFLFTACENDTSYFPYQRVNFHLNLNVDLGVNLTGIGGYYRKGYDNKKENEEIGLGGVLVYHNINDADAYSAFDLACPVETSRMYLISMPDEKGIVKCNRCGSTFNLWYGNGNPESGPAAAQKRRLQSYPVNQSGTILTISN
ncbi:MAG: hypothetical protein FWF54_05090 [Candidatus Azobacteroides sp.]|nr:hypothetical protein [Candidatus Azobacteroides sp.]